MTFAFKELVTLVHQCTSPSTCQTTGTDQPSANCDPKKRHPGYLAALEAVRLELRAELAAKP